MTMTRTDQGYSIYDQVFERAEMLSTIEGLSAIARTKAGARHVLKVPTVRELAYIEYAAAVNFGSGFELVVG